MNLKILSGREGYLSERPGLIPLSAEFASAPAVMPIRPQKRAAEIVPVSGGVMPWGVFAAYAAALASTGFLLVMALTGGFHLD